VATIGHPNIPGFYGSHSSGNGRVIILDYIPNDWKPNDEEVRDMEGALDYLHNQAKIRHRDVKPDNVILVIGKAILIQFGCTFDWCATCPADDSDYHRARNRPLSPI
jgi:serine/threonine protein kinase